MEVKVTTENFEKEVLQSELPVLVDFYADWCGPCQMLAPAVAEIAREKEGQVKVCKINVDDETPLAIRYGVNSIPALMVFKNGQVTNTSIGYCQKADILKML